MHKAILFLALGASWVAADLDAALRMDGECGPDGEDCSLNALQVKASSAEVAENAKDADTRSLLNARDEEVSDDVDPWKKANKQYKKAMKPYKKAMKKGYGYYLQEGEEQADAETADADARSLLNARDAEVSEEETQGRRRYYKKMNKQYKKQRRHYKKMMKKGYGGGYGYHPGYGPSPYGYPPPGYGPSPYYLQEDEDQQAEEEKSDELGLLSAHDAEEPEDADPVK